MLRSNIDYVYYFDTYSCGKEGVISPSDFDFYVSKAWTEIEALCPVKDCGDENRDALCSAVCAVAEILYNSEKNSGVQSESIDGYSVTYRDENSSRREIRRTAIKYLGSTGLMYAGVGEC